MQDRYRQIVDSLATHGRTIHLGQKLTSERITSNVSCGSQAGITPKWPVISGSHPLPDLPHVVRLMWSAAANTK